MCALSSPGYIADLANHKSAELARPVATYVGRSKQDTGHLRIFHGTLISPDERSFTKRKEQVVLNIFGEGWDHSLEFYASSTTEKKLRVSREEQVPILVTKLLHSGKILSNYAGIHTRATI